MRTLIRYFNYLVMYLIMFRGNKVAYLRHCGLRIGQNSEINASIWCFGSEPWLIDIGDRVTIAPGVFFVTHDASSRLFRQNHPEMNQVFGNRFGTIRILENSFIGVNAVLLPNIVIGPNSVVGAGSVVTKSVPPGLVVAGNPARVVCSLTEYVERCKSKSVAVCATDRKSLRSELTKHFWGETR